MMEASIEVGVGTLLDLDVALSQTFGTSILITVL